MFLRLYVFGVAWKAGGEGVEQQGQNPHLIFSWKIVIHNHTTMNENDLYMHRAQLLSLMGTGVKCG